MDTASGPGGRGGRHGHAGLPRLRGARGGGLHRVAEHSVFFDNTVAGHPGNSVADHAPCIVADAVANHAPYYIVDNTVAGHPGNRVTDHAPYIVADAVTDHPGNNVADADANSITNRAERRLLQR